MRLDVLEKEKAMGILTNQNNREGAKVGGKKNVTCQGGTLRVLDHPNVIVGQLPGKKNYSSTSKFDSKDGDDENNKHYHEDPSNNSKMPSTSVSDPVDVAEAFQPQQQ